MYQRSLVPSSADALAIVEIVIETLLLSLAAIALGIRLWSRKIQRQGLFLNDYAAVLAWILAASLVIVSYIANPRYGAYQHIESINPAKLPDILKSYLAANFVLAAANTSIRISVLHFYITIFRSNKAFLTVAYAVIALVLAFFIGVVVSDVLTCRPLAKYWDPLQPGTCESPLRSLIALSSTNVATDLTIVLLPMPMVWGLQMATRRKVELTITFALGFLVCVLTIIRLILSIQINLNDFTYGITKISIVTIPEPLLGIVVACLPLFPPALKKITGRGRKTNPETRNVLSSSMARLRLKRSKNSSFQRFDDSLALTDIENNKTHNSITGPSSDADAFDKDYNELRGVGSIKIKQDWEVRSDEAKHLEAKVQI